MNLKVRSPEYYGFRAPVFHLPRELGCYSTNADRQYCNDDHQMNYLSMPDEPTDVCFDLNEGYSDFVAAIDDEMKGERILKWILSHEEKIKQNFAEDDSKTKIDFICARSLLTQLGSTIYENTKDWEIYATKFRSVIYLLKQKTEQKLQTEVDLGEKGKLRTSWGFKFEQYMTSDVINSKPNTSIPVNENAKYHSVLKLKLDDHRILLRAEIDAVDPKHFTTYGHDPTSTLRYVELKTSRIITTQRQKRNFMRYKLLKWYLQSYFAGVPRVICGFRDDDGIVRDLVNFNVRDMPKKAKEYWSPEPCLKFCSRFLNYLKKCVVKDDPKVVYKISWKPGSDISCEELPSENHFLPEWYTESVTVI